ELSLRPAALHVGEHRSFLAGVGEGEAGEATVGRGDERRAERAGMEAVGELEAFAARLPFAGRHRLVGDEQVVQPAGAGEADLVARVEHARGVAQQLARMVERQRLYERLACQPAPAAEPMIPLV